MMENHLAMVSEWMTHGNINQFVRGHGDANRFELVGSPLTPPGPRFCSPSITSIAGGRCEGLDAHAPSPNGPRGPERSTSPGVQIPHLLTLIN
jgi:hypothetical protein